MNKSEARDILGLSKDFDKESLRLQYHTQFIETFRLKSASLTIENSKSLEAKLADINRAFSILDGSEIQNVNELQFDFRFEKFEKKITATKSHRSRNDLVRHVENLIQQKRYGLALSILEIGIKLSFLEESEISLSSVERAINTLGKVIIQLGMVNQGLRYLNYKTGNYEKAQNYRRVGEYKLAAHHFALEMMLRESDVPLEDLCQRISICYFLLNDFENSIKIIEEVLPQITPRKSVFEGACDYKNFATAIVVSMNKLNAVSGKKFDNIRVRLKYPLCFKYLQKCHGNIDDALAILANFKNDSNAYEEFLNSLKPEPFITEEVDLQYSLSELEENYDLFEQPMKKSLIYNPK